MQIKEKKIPIIYLLFENFILALYDEELIRKKLNGDPN